jgi:hypothetical protein
MRLNVLILALLSSAGAAQAGSIEAIRTGQDAVRSIERIDCTSCARRAKKKQAEAAIELAPGTQKIEIREVEGVRKIYRTEAWLGGSPAVYVSKALPDAEPAVAEGQPALPEEAAAIPAAPVAEPQVPAEASMIDETSTTSAVTADIGADAKVEPKTATFDPAKLELRIN